MRPSWGGLGKGLPQEDPGPVSSSPGPFSLTHLTATSPPSSRPSCPPSQPPCGLSTFYPLLCLPSLGAPWLAMQPPHLLLPLQACPFSPTLQSTLRASLKCSSDQVLP